MHHRLSIPGSSLVRALVTLSVASAFVIAVPAVAVAAATCDGLVATHVGTAGADTIIGTNGDDVIVARGGNDFIKGKDGHDVICAGTGDDEVIGGPGKDVIHGGGGDDLLWGKGGRDIIRGNTGDDELRGGKGNDDIYGGDDADALYGGDHDDYLSGGAGADIIWGGLGVDIAAAGDGTDECKAETEVACERDPIDFTIERFYVNQSVPAADSNDSASSRLATIDGRGGVIRVFVAANHAQQGVSPKVVLHWRAGGDQGAITLSGPGTVPTNPNEANLSKTFNHTFGDSFLRNGMDVYVEVDPSNEIRENADGNNRWPASGWFDLDVTAMPSFDVTFVPITLNGSTASVSMSDAESMLDETLSVHPIASYDIDIRAPYAFDGSTSQGWVDLLFELADLRDADASNRVYYGVLPSAITPGTGGIGFIGYPVALGLEDDHIVAHELGHTLNLLHAPCGSVADADANYPYGGGAIGSWGYDMSSGALVDPSSNFDVMSYCNPSWISDYNYGNVIDFRSTYGYAASYGEAGVGETVLSFTGSISGGGDAAGPGLTSSSYAGDAAAGATVRSMRTSDVSVRGATGDYTLVGRDGSGNVLFASGFEAYAYADGPGGDERLFRVNVTLDALDAAGLVSVDIVHRGRVLTTTSVGSGS